MGGIFSSGTDDMADKAQVKATVEELIKQDRVVIFSKSTCPYCWDAKKVFDRLKQKYQAIELNQHPQGATIQDVLNDMTGARTVPRVFVDGTCIGGGDDTVRLEKSGELAKMLK